MICSCSNLRLSLPVKLEAAGEKKTLHFRQTYPQGDLLITSKKNNEPLVRYQTSPQTLLVGPKFSSSWEKMSVSGKLIWTTHGTQVGTRVSDWYMNIHCSSPSELKVINKDVQPHLTLIRCFETPADSLNYSTPTNEPDSNFPCFGLLLAHCRLFMRNSLHTITWTIIPQGNQFSWNSGTPNFQQTKVFMTDPRTGEETESNQTDVNRVNSFPPWLALYSSVATQTMHTPHLDSSLLSVWPWSQWHHLTSCTPSPSSPPPPHVHESQRSQKHCRTREWFRYIDCVQVTEDHINIHVLLLIDNFSETV